MVEEKFSRLESFLWFLIISLSGLALILIVVGGIISSNPETLSFGVTIFSAGVGIFSLSIAIISLLISNKSDLKMQSISNASFIELIHTIEDKGIPLYNGKPSIEEIDTISWRIFNYFQQANELKRWVNPENQKNMVNQLQTLIEKLFYAKAPRAWVEFKNLRNACEIAIKFDVDNEVKNELIHQLGYWLGYKNEDESNENYLERKAKQMASKKPHDLFVRHKLDSD